MKILGVIFSALVTWGLILAAVWLVFTAHAASAQECINAPGVPEHLFEKWGEVELWSGDEIIAGVAGAKLHLYTNPGGTTWSLLREPIPGVLCMIASGPVWTVPRRLPVKTVVEPEKPA